MLNGDEELCSKLCTHYLLHTFLLSFLPSFYNEHWYVHHTKLTPGYKMNIKYNLSSHEPGILGGCTWKLYIKNLGIGFANTAILCRCLLPAMANPICFCTSSSMVSLWIVSLLSYLQSSEKLHVLSTRAKWFNYKSSFPSQSYSRIHVLSCCLHTQ